MRKRGWRVFFHPHAKVYHIQGASAKKVNTRARVEYWRSRYTFFRKHTDTKTQLTLRAGLFIRLLLNLTLNLSYNIITLFMLRKARERLGLYTVLTLWHLAGCPASWGLSPSKDG